MHPYQGSHLGKPLLEHDYKVQEEVDPSIMWILVSKTFPSIHPNSELIVWLSQTSAQRSNRFFWTYNQVGTPISALTFELVAYYWTHVQDGPTPNNIKESFQLVEMMTFMGYILGHSHIYREKHVEIGIKLGLRKQGLCLMMSCCCH